MEGSFTAENNRFKGLKRQTNRERRRSARPALKSKGTLCGLPSLLSPLSLSTRTRHLDFSDGTDAWALVPAGQTHFLLR
jgi:hypothetical protein